MSEVFNRVVRFVRRAGWYLIADVAIVVLVYRVALPLRFAGFAGEPSSIAPEVMAYWMASWRHFVFWIVLIHIVANIVAGVYSRMWRFASAPDVLIIAGAWLMASVPIVLIDFLWQTQIRLLPLSTVGLGGFLSFAGFTLVRYRSRLFASAIFRLRRMMDRRGAGSQNVAKVLIVGAGETAQTLSWQLQNRKKGNAYQVVGFIDDDPDKMGMNVHGSPVLGNRHRIPQLVIAHGVDLIMLAIHAISGQQIREIINICQKTPAKIKVVPDMLEVLSKNPTLPLMRDIGVQDLLGRTSTEIDLESYRSILAERVVLVTGGAGSIGAELCRQLVEFSPSCVVAVDTDESALYGLQIEMGIRGLADGLIIRVANVADEAEMQMVFSEYRPGVVFHAAAYKHVPMMEDHPRAALRTNALGTMIVGRAAAEVGVDRFVLISTDKAVNPVSVRGATKRLCEYITVGLAADATRTQFTAVRFGNVLASRGSVVPMFEQQIDAGGPVTVTHPEMTRFFMTLPEAVRLVIQAAALTEGGDLYMLDMGERIRIVDLAERMIRLRGLRPQDDIPIVFTGLRAGEKMHEELLAEFEYREATRHPFISRILSQKEMGSNGRSLKSFERWLQAGLQQPEGELGSRLIEYSRHL